MGRIHQITTAWSRHHRSGGFGIHSPSAYAFVRDVLCERLPYYAYADLAAARQAVTAAATRRECHDMHLASLSYARLLLRITNHFNPGLVVQAGTGGGLDTLAMMLVNSRLRLKLLDADIERHPLTVQTLQPVLGRLDCYNDAATLAAEVREVLTPADGKPMLVVNRVDSEDDLPAIDDLLRWCVAHEGVAVVCGLQHHDSIEGRLWQACEARLTSGHTFSNGKMVVAVASSKLPRQHFSLWL